MAGYTETEEDKKKTGATPGTDPNTDETNGGAGNGSTGNGNTDTTDTTVDENLKAITDPYDASIGDTQDMINTLTGSKNQYEEDTKTINKQNKKVSMWGGIAEAAAGLVNLFGTMGGATAMKWESPQNKWQDRIHTIAKEREAKLEKYNSQLTSLNQQLNQLNRAKGQAVAQYKKNDAKVQTQTEIYQAKSKATLAALTQKATDAAKTRISTNASKDFSAWLRSEYTNYGRPTEETMQKMSDFYYEQAVKRERLLYPDLFKEDALPDSSFENK